MLKEEATPLHLRLKIGISFLVTLFALIGLIIFLFVENKVSGLESDYTGDGLHFVSNDVAFTVGCSPGSTASLRVRRPPPFEPDLRRIPRKDRAEILKRNLEDRAHQRESAERQCEMFLLTVPAALSAFKSWGNGEQQRMLPPQQAHIGYQAPLPMITDSGSDQSLFKISVEPSLKYDIGGDDD